MRNNKQVKQVKQETLRLSQEMVSFCERAEVDPGPDESRRLLTDADFSRIAADLAEGSLAEPLWIFAYGSLIWKNDLKPIEMRRVAAFGWHRSFCMIRRRWRGSPAQPGLMMALQRGGRCDGIAYCFSSEERLAQIEYVLRREIEYCDSVPFMRWVHVSDGTARWRALASWVGPVGPEIAPGKPLDNVARSLARACGHVGSSAEYLYKTVSALEQFGIRDRNLWKLQHLVAQEVIMMMDASARAEAQYAEVDDASPER